MFKKYQDAVKPKLTEHDDLMKYAGAGVQRLRPAESQRAMGRFKSLGALDNGSIMVASSKRLALLPAKLGSLFGAD